MCSVRFTSITIEVCWHVGVTNSEVTVAMARGTDRCTISIKRISEHDHVELSQGIPAFGDSRHTDFTYFFNRLRRAGACFLLLPVVDQVA